MKHFYNQKILHESTTSTISNYEDAFEMSRFSHKALKKHRLAALKDALENHIVEDFLIIKEHPEEGINPSTADLVVLARGPELRSFTTSLASTTLLRLLEGNNLLGEEDQDYFVFNRNFAPLELFERFVGFYVESDNPTADVELLKLVLGPQRLGSSYTYTTLDERKEHHSSQRKVMIKEAKRSFDALKL